MLNWTANQLLGGDLTSRVGQKSSAPIPPRLAPLHIRQHLNHVYRLRQFFSKHTLRVLERRRVRLPTFFIAQFGTFVKKEEKEEERHTTSKTIAKDDERHHKRTYLIAIETLICTRCLRLEISHKCSKYFLKLE